MAIAGLVEACFLPTIAYSPHFCHLHELLCFSAHDCMLSTHRFILSCLFVFEYVCECMFLHLGFGMCVCVFVCWCVFVCVCAYTYVGVV
jgi:hypothetical protein